MVSRKQKVKKIKLPKRSSPKQRRQMGPYYEGLGIEAFEKGTRGMKDAFDLAAEIADDPMSLTRRGRRR